MPAILYVRAWAGADGRTPLKSLARLNDGSLGYAGFNGKPGSPPFGKSLDKSAGAAPMRAQDFDRAIGVYAIRPAAVRDVLFLFRKPPQLSLKIVDRDRKRPRHVAGRILARPPRNENDDPVPSRSPP